MEWIVDRPISLLEALKAHYPESSNNTIRRWLEHKRVTVDGKVTVVAAHPLSRGQHLQVLPQGQISRQKEGARFAAIVYEDRYLTVVDKRAGALSVATPREIENTVHAELKQRYYPNKVFVVHRLDQGTSGLMVFARDQEVFEQLKDMLTKHTIQRQYLALVQGTPQPTQGTWQSYLFEDDNYHVHSSESPRHGEEAITHYEVLAQKGNFSILHVTLATGKKNQIRVHCQLAGVPIVGDEKYGETQKLLPRLGLHAYSLRFSHPHTGKTMHFHSPAPRCFTRLIPAALWVKAPITLEGGRGARV